MTMVFSLMDLSSSYMLLMVFGVPLLIVLAVAGLVVLTVFLIRRAKRKSEADKLPAGKTAPRNSNFI